MRRGEGLQAGRALLALLGVWLVVGHWVGSYARHAHAVEDTTVGALVIFAAFISMFAGPWTPVPLWAALLLGIWTFLTPMMFGQAGSSFSANNDIVVGMLIVLVSAVAIVSYARLRLAMTVFDTHAASEQTSLS